MRGGGRLRPTDTVVISPATHHPRGRNSFWVRNIENLSSSSWSSSLLASSSSSSSKFHRHRNCHLRQRWWECQTEAKGKERNLIREPVFVDCNFHSLLSLLANNFYRAIIIWRGADEKVGKRRHCTCRAPYREVIVSNNDRITKQFLFHLFLFKF